jgi:rhamnogalacturonyl hydrolase YesR
VARELARRYGHDLDQAVYIPAMALIGRLRLGEVADVERIVAPYVSGAKRALEKPTGSHLSGHLVFGELARITGKPRDLDLARAAADLGFDEQGRPRPAMPLHNEMSDSVFMGCPILAQVGRLTGEAKYFDMALRHMRFMLSLNLRPDGLHRHSPLDQAAWGRGNGFPALGLALSLSEIPRAHPGQAEMLRAFQSHLEALLPHQDPAGMWRQVIDRPESYRELTATCMIAFAMERGVRSGWIAADRYRPAIARAWTAIRARIAPDGGLVDVCTGTGKQKSLRDYYDRTAILGPDPRGGAMALLIATELAAAGAGP